MRELFDEIVGDHRLQFGDATTGDTWHAVLKVALDAGMAVISASYRAVAKQPHADRNAGDGGAMVRLKRAYAEVRQAWGAW